MPIQESYLLVAPLTYTGTKSTGFTYSFEDILPVGTLVQVPLGKRQSLGVVIESGLKKPDFATKPITRPLAYPPLPKHLVTLATWMTEYYFASPKSVWQTILPSGLTTKHRTPKMEAQLTSPKQDLPLNDEQSAAISTIWEGKDRSYLLYGVTSSGKTRVYIELTERTLALGRSIIVLVPEIVLTPQLVATFQAHFGDLVIVNHSRMTEGQRHASWQAALEASGPRVIIGPRSSLFLPIADPGLIVIDEAHETSYKQDRNPHYQTEVVAAKLASLTNAKLVLGSATPSLWEVYLAEHGKLNLVRMPSRANNIPAPEAQVIDARDKTLYRTSKILSQPLVDNIAATLLEQRQSLLFINRRGSATSHICNECGYVSLCPHCQLPLTFHADQARLACHYCNYHMTAPAVCPNCQSANMRFIGVGTKRVEAEVARLFPEARLARLDKDSATLPYLHTVYEGLRNHTIDVLIGTQMVAKGLDLPHVDTVGIISADTMLHFPDFSATERTYQLLTQVSGRSGRGDRAGQVIIQSHTPDHPAINYAAHNDFWGFATHEMAARKLLSYPPYVHLVKLTYANKDESKARNKAEELTISLRQQPGLIVTGPAPAFHAQMNGQYHWHVIVRSAVRSRLVTLVRSIPTDWSTDLDPINLL